MSSRILKLRLFDTYNPTPPPDLDLDGGNN